MKTKDLVLIAFYVALFAVLDYMGTVLGLFRMPQGGSFSISEVALVLGVYHFGFKKGLLLTALSFPVMFIIKAPSIIHPIQFILDYLLGYMSYALVALIPDWRIRRLSLPLGVVAASFARLMFSNLSGWIFYSEWYVGNVLWGVVAYNLTWWIPTTVATFILVMLVRPALQPVIDKYTNK